MEFDKGSGTLLAVPDEGPSSPRRACATTPMAIVAEAVATGRPIVVLDTDGSGQLVMSAAKADAESVAYLVRHTAGFLAVALYADLCDRLGLPRMWPWSSDSGDAEYGVAVDALEGTTTGISALDRATTARRLADLTATAAHFTRPGHIIPIRVKRESDPSANVPAAALRLMQIVGLPAAAIISPIVSCTDPTQLAKRGESLRFAATERLAVFDSGSLSAVDLSPWNGDL